MAKVPVKTVRGIAEERGMDYEDIGRRRAPSQRKQGRQDNRDTRRETPPPRKAQRQENRDTRRETPPPRRAQRQENRDTRRETPPPRQEKRQSRRSGGGSNAPVEDAQSTTLVTYVPSSQVPASAPPGGKPAPASSSPAWIEQSAVGPSDGWESDQPIYEEDLPLVDEEEVLDENRYPEGTIQGRRRVPTWTKPVLIDPHIKIATAVGYRLAIETRGEGTFVIVLVKDSEIAGKPRSEVLGGIATKLVVNAAKGLVQPQDGPGVLEQLTDPKTINAITSVTKAVADAKAPLPTEAIDEADFAGPLVSALAIVTGRAHRRK